MRGKGLGASMIMKTINSVFQESIKNNGSRVAFIKGSVDGSENITYDCLAGMVRGFALGLRALGVKKGDTVALISENRSEWAVADLGLLHAGAVTVALFPTLPAGQVRYALEDCGACAVIVSDEGQLKKVMDWAGEEAGRRIIIMDGPAGGAPNLLTFDEVIKRGSEGRPAGFDKLWKDVAPEDMAGIIYTSGTTGRPMGVALSHRNIVASLTAAVDAVAFGAGEAIVSFLPLNHVLARLSDHYLPLSVGASIAYVRSAREIRPVVKAVRPQFLTLVPRVLEMYREGILSALEKAPSLKRSAFDKFFTLGLKRCCMEEGGGEPDPEMNALCKKGDELVFGRIREELGLDRLKFFVSGGAPLSIETARFFRVLGLEVVEGYGLTETMALVAVNRPGRTRPGTVGPPVKGVEVRLSKEGEILVRGGGVMEGYWKRPAETAHAVDAEGWLNTGDMGQVDDDGFLRIRGRLKEIMVLSTGKNVAPLPIEERLKESPYISQIIVTGDNRSAITALIAPDFRRVRVWLKVKEGQEAGAEPSDAEVAGNPEVKTLIRDEIKRLSGGLAGFERVKRFALLKKAFTVEDGELTPTLKIRRKAVLRKYGDVVESLYR